MLIAEGIILAIEMCFNRIRAGAFGNRSQTMLNREPGPVPANEGRIAPETVPEEVEEIISFINDPEPFRCAGAKLGNGILLYGVPGTGKTQLGFYLARNTGAKVIHETAAGLLAPEQGSGAASIRYLFDRAYNKSIWSRIKGFVRSLAMRVMRRRAQAQEQIEKPMILILDEIDAIGSNRQIQVTEKDRAREAERVRALEQLLPELDGAHEQAMVPKVFVIGTTNRPLWEFDEALIRESRLAPVYVPSPDQQQREAILRYHSGMVPHPLAPGVDLAEIAQQTVGYRGDALRCLVNGAAMRASRRMPPQINQEDLHAVLNRTERIKQMRRQNSYTEISI